MTARIFQLNISPGGVPKLPVREVRIGRLGLEGDGHDHPKHHGGPDRAVCLYALEVIQALQDEGHPIFPGAAGENVTVSGLPWAEVVPGVRLALGDEVVVEIASYTEPCKLIAASFHGKDFRTIDQDVRPGWSRLYARVVTEGVARIGAHVRLV